jgi:hypothetical protein
MKIKELLQENEMPFTRDREREIKPEKPEKGSNNTEYTKPNTTYNVRTAELEKAADKVKNGEMSSREFWKLVGKHNPVTKYDEVPDPASIKDMVASLRGNGQYDKIDKDIQDGQLVHLRLDINAYKNYNVWAPTIHSVKSGGGIGPSISHMPTAIVNNVSFTVEKTEDPTHKQNPIRIATGEIDKYPVATVTGNYEWANAEDAKKEAQAAMNDQTWIQVGMDPRRHSYFYDRSNRRPVVGGDRAIQVGGLILLKNPTYGKRSDFLYENSIDREIIKWLGK